MDRINVLKLTDKLYSFFHTRIKLAPKQKEYSLFEDKDYIPKDKWKKVNVDKRFMRSENKNNAEERTSRFLVDRYYGLYPSLYAMKLNNFVNFIHFPVLILFFSLIN